MKKQIIKIAILAKLIIATSGCVLDPNFYIWRDGDKQDKNIPWAGNERRVVDQYRRYILPYSDKGYETDLRWRVSKFNSVSPFKIDNQIAKYLINKSILQRWGFKAYSSGNGIFHKANSTYELTLISISPSIMIMRPYSENDDLSRDNYEIFSPHLIDKRNALYSEYFYIPLRYGITLSYQPNLLYFSPDLDILPQPLNLSKNQKTTIYWNRLFTSGAIEFSEKNGIVHTKRIDNKTGKDLKKDGNYGKREGNYEKI
jgi:hypothetical protein